MFTRSDLLGLVLFPFFFLFLKFLLQCSCQYSFLEALSNEQKQPQKFPNSAFFVFGKNISFCEGGAEKIEIQCEPAQVEMKWAGQKQQKNCCKLFSLARLSLEQNHQENKARMLDCGTCDIEDRTAIFLKHCLHAVNKLASSYGKSH
jgi:hypothetical protein